MLSLYCLLDVFVMLMFLAVSRFVGGRLQNVADYYFQRRINKMRLYFNVEIISTCAFNCCSFQHCLLLQVALHHAHVAVRAVLAELPERPETGP